MSEDNLVYQKCPPTSTYLSQPEMNLQTMDQEYNSIVWFCNSFPRILEVMDCHVAEALYETSALHCDHSLGTILQIFSAYFLSSSF